MDNTSGSRFAQRLENLIRSTGKSAPQIAGEIRARSGGDASLSDSYFWQLRTGKKDPRLGVVRAIADYFGVAPSYFMDDAVEETDVALAKQRITAGERHVRNIAARARGLKLGTLQRIAEIVEDARILDGLDTMSGVHIENEHTPTEDAHTS
jgi:transcriptional regulator with XRE-family HTH domain